MNFSLTAIGKKALYAMPAAWQRWFRRRYYLNVVRQFSESDWEWTPHLKPLIRPGAVVLDVGANVGYITACFARWVGPQGRVVAAEPIPETHDSLRNSMRRLFPKNVAVWQVCVSDRCGEVSMQVPRYAHGGRNYYESRVVQVPEGSADLVRVPALTLDEWVARQQLERVDFIKIDVEGHERAVIRGAEETMRRWHPPLLIEVSGDPDVESGDAAVLFAMLRDHGYMAFRIHAGRLVARQPGDKSVDYLFLNALNATVN